MTLTYALIADRGIVLAADSQVTYTHNVADDRVGSRIVGTYERTRSKIRRLGKYAALSMSGNAGLADTLLTRAESSQIDTSQPFEKLVKAYGTAFCEVWFNERTQLAPRIEVAFLFCGYMGSRRAKHPHIVKLDSNRDFNYNPITNEGFAFTGAVEHGAVLYLHHRFYRPRMPLEQAKLLAYCIVAEVADQDNSVGGPIEVEVISPNGSKPLRGSEIRKYENFRQDLISTFQRQLSDFHI